MGWPTFSTRGVGDVSPGYHGGRHADADTGQSRQDSMDDYRAIEPNAIADTFNELTKEQVARKMGALGK